MKQRNVTFFIFTKVNTTKRYDEKTPTSLNTTDVWFGLSPGSYFWCDWFGSTPLHIPDSLWPARAIWSNMPSQATWAVNTALESCPRAQENSTRVWGSPMAVQKGTRFSLSSLNKYLVYLKATTPVSIKGQCFYLSCCNWNKFVPFTFLVKVKFNKTKHQSCSRIWKL